MHEMVSIQIKTTRMKTSITSEVLVKQGLTNRLSESSNEKRKKDF